MRGGLRSNRDPKSEDLGHPSSFDTEPLRITMSFWRKLFGRSQSASSVEIDVKWNPRHAFLFLRDREVAEMFHTYRDIWEPKLWDGLFPDYERTEAEMTFVADPDMPDHVRRKLDLFKYPFGAMFIQRVRPDLMHATGHGSGTFVMVRFELDIPTIGEEKGVGVCVLTR